MENEIWNGSARDSVPCHCGEDKKTNSHHLPVPGPFFLNKRIYFRPIVSSNCGVKGGSHSIRALRVSFPFVRFKM
jgi:hypothetical protein